ncbi:hypothetical protein A0U40_14075 [[Bacillus] sp. KCTC 13219]|nr:hypothetical protein A0U40_14075 [[Bacillus] sp. KCTC 13219]
MNVFPENTIEAYKGCLDLGFTMIEQDVHKLLDGSLAVIHDYTMERSTDATGCVRDFTTMRFKNSKVDTLPGWTAKSTTFKDVLNTFGNNAIYVPEIKVPDVAEDVVDAIIFAGLEEYCLIQSFRLSDLSYAVSKGLPALLLTNDESPITIKNNGIDYVGVSTQVTEQYILDCINAGLKVIVYSVNRRYLHDYFLDLGVSGFFTDDPLWITRKSPILNKDTFREQMFTHGQLGLSRHDLRPNVGNSGDRGEFISPNKFGWTNYTTGGIDDKNDFCLMGWTGELPENFTLNYNLTLKNSSGTPTTWGAVTFCTTIDIYRDINDVDNPDTPSYGYNLLLRENGNLQLYKRTASGAVVLGSVQTTALTNNSTARIKVQVQGDNITCTRVDTNQSFTVEDDEFRKGYLHVGRRASAVLFSDMSIT